MHLMWLAILLIRWSGLWLAILLIQWSGLRWECLSPEPIARSDNAERMCAKGCVSLSRYSHMMDHMIGHVRLGEWPSATTPPELFHKFTTELVSFLLIALLVNIFWTNPLLLCSFFRDTFFSSLRALNHLVLSLRWVTSRYPCPKRPSISERHLNFFRAMCLMRSHIWLEWWTRIRRIIKDLSIGIARWWTKLFLVTRKILFVLMIELNGESIKKNFLITYCTFVEVALGA